MDGLSLLDAAGIRVDDVGLRRPTLDNIFLTLTGHEAQNASAAGSSRTKEKSR